MPTIIRKAYTVALFITLTVCPAAWDHGVRASALNPDKFKNISIEIKEHPSQAPEITAVFIDTGPSVDVTGLLPVNKTQKTIGLERSDPKNDITILDKPLSYGAATDRKSLSGIEGFSASGSLIRPMGGFADDADFGYGITLSMYGSLPQLPRWSLFMTSGFYDIKGTSRTVASYRLITIRASLGYIFPLYKRCNAMFFAGGALITRYITNNEETIDRGRYYSYPGISAGWEIRYAIADRVDFFLGPVLTLSMQDGQGGSFMTGNAGLRFIY